MYIAIGIILMLIGAVTVWFNIPYSPVKQEFRNDISALKSENGLPLNGDVFSKDDFKDCPASVQKFIENSGYIGAPKMSYLKMQYNDVDFKQGRNGPMMKIDYTVYNFVKEPCRMALIDSCMFSTPFEGYDYYRNGAGGMKGVIAKAITIFNQTGAEMDKACLVTYLSESMFAPTILLQDYITFEEMDEFKVRATITFGGQTASGIFTFNESYEMVSFTTNDRGVANADGTMEYVPWSAVCGEYKVNDNGIRLPTKFKAVWNYPDEDFVYFDGAINEFDYGK